MVCDHGSCEAPCSEGHTSCARHAACARAGVFDPERCPVCAGWITVIRETHPDSRSELPEWLRLKDQFLLAHLMTIQQNRVELRWASAEAASLFPGLGMAAEPAGNSGSSLRTGPSSSNVNIVMELIHQLNSHLGATGRSKSRQSRSRTRYSPTIRRRPSSSSSSSRSRTRGKRRRRYSSTSSTSSSSSTNERIPAGSKVPAESTVPANQTSTPKDSGSLQSQGWIPAPANWQLWERAAGELKVFQTTVQDGRSVLTEVENVDVTTIETADGPAMFWRGRKVENKLEPSRPFNRIKAMAGGLVGLRA